MEPRAPVCGAAPPSRRQHCLSTVNLLSAIATCWAPATISVVRSTRYSDRRAPAKTEEVPATKKNMGQTLRGIATEIKASIHGVQESRSMQGGHASPSHQTQRPFPFPATFPKAYDKLCGSLGDQPTHWQVQTKQALLKRYSAGAGKQNRSILLKSLNGLDSMLSSGKLRRRAYVDFFNNGGLPKCRALGPSVTVTVPRDSLVRTALSSSVWHGALPSARDKVWGTLLHQMLHAYHAILPGVVGRRHRRRTANNSCYGALCRDVARRIADYSSFPNLNSHSIDGGLRDNHKPVDEIAFHQNFHFGKDHRVWRQMPKVIPISAAYDELRRLLERPLTLEQYQARDRIYKALTSAGRGAGPDAILRAFDDIDTVLFGGVLRYRVHVQWIRKIECYDFVGQFQSPVGTRNYSQRGKIVLHFDHPAYPETLDRHLYQCGTLIHEMLHAYLWVMSEDMDEVCHCKAQVYHGPMWMAATKALAWKLDFSNLGGRHVGEDVWGRCHLWNNYAEFVENRDAERVGADDYDRYT